jgi:hypothetical protein
MHSKIVSLFAGFSILVSFSVADLQAAEVKASGEAGPLVRSLESVQNHARSERRWLGGTLIGLGVASAIGGVVASESDSVATGTLWVLSGFFPATGVLALLLPNHQETLSESFLATVGSGHALSDSDRVRGETLLASFAAEGKQRRLMSAGALGIGGAALGALALHYQATSATGDSSLGLPYLAVGAAYIGVGLAQWFGKSFEEETHENYIKNRAQGMSAESSDWSIFVSPHFAQAGTPGATLGVSVGF